MDEDTKREIAIVKEYLELVIANNESRHQQTSESQREALRVALASNDKRLDGMNEFRAALSDQAARMTTRQEYENNKSTIAEKIDQLQATYDSRFDSELKPVVSRLDQLGKPNWTLMISVISIFFVMIAGVWLVIGLKIDATVAPMALGLAEQSGLTSTNSSLLRSHQDSILASTQADAISRADRAQLNERIRALETSLAVNLGERRAQFGIIQARLVEVETQFCGNDVVRNLMHANDLRVLAILWHKAFPDSTLPTDNAFYPKICRDSGVGLDK